MAKKAQQKVEEQPDLEERLEAIDQWLWKMASAVENMSESIEEINKELFRLTHLLEERRAK